MLDPPSDIDASGHSFSAHQVPRQTSIPFDRQFLSTQRLSVEKIQQISQNSVRATPSSGNTAATITPKAVTTYTPAQIRAAYNLPPLPTSFSNLTPQQAASYGAGQTIYIVDAQHDPNVAAELAQFNQKFGLPSCSTTVLSTATTLPLAPASTTAGCSLLIAYSNTNGGFSNTPPAYDSGWASEIALDVQWAHATAPLARIVLIETMDAGANLPSGILLANAMGPGVVSMSFGGNEGAYVTSYDSLFTGKNMAYLAAAGDSGAAVEWPAVSPKVLAVGGTTLNYTPTARSEVVWSGSGGGISNYMPAPSYQTSAIPGLGSVARRSVSDISMNADPSTGQYVAIINPGSTTTSWLSIGGTSLSTPQWAGLLAVANAIRTLNKQSILASPHAALYTQIATSSAAYSADFFDILQGANGTCSICSAHKGYDQPTGLGSPNGLPLLNALSGYTPPPTAPVISGATITGTVGTALTFTVSASSANPLTYSITGAPAGLVINSSTGVVSWPTPVAGNYQLTVTVKDSKTNLTAQGTYVVQIAAPTAPKVTSQTVTAIAGTPWTFTPSFTSINPVTWIMTGAPAGLTLNSSTGVLTWNQPVAGNYTVQLTAKDTKTNLTGQGTYS